MARQKGILYLRGTINDLTFYQMNGTYLVRKKTSLNKERVSTDPAFLNSRKSNVVFATAAKTALKIYQGLPGAKRKKGFYGKLTGIANTLLHEGKTTAEVYAELKRITDNA